MPRSAEDPPATTGPQGPVAGDQADICVAVPASHRREPWEGQVAELEALSRKLISCNDRIVFVNSGDSKELSLPSLHCVMCKHSLCQRQPCGPQELGVVREDFPEEASGGLQARASGRGVRTRPGEAESLKHVLPGVDTGLWMELRLRSPRRERSLEKAGPGRPGKTDGGSGPGRAFSYLPALPVLGQVCALPRVCSKR